MMRRAERLDGLGSLIGQGGTRYRRLLKILIESGGMYCLTWLILLCLILTGSMASHVFLAIIGQLTVSQLPRVPKPTSIRNPLIPDAFLKIHRGNAGDIPDVDHRTRIAEFGPRP